VFFPSLNEGGVAERSEVGVGEAKNPLKGPESRGRKRNTGVRNLD